MTGPTKLQEPMVFAGADMSGADLAHRLRRLADLLEAPSDSLTESGARLLIGEYVLRADETWIISADPFTVDDRAVGVPPGPGGPAVPDPAESLPGGSSGTDAPSSSAPPGSGTTRNDDTIVEDIAEAMHQAGRPGARVSAVAVHQIEWDRLAVAHRIQTGESLQWAHDLRIWGAPIFVDSAVPPGCVDVRVRLRTHPR